ncbi:MAG: phospho-N-acetylmuramoyl-pentapeptide-transferase [Patescibacteria group bacterium]
MIQFIALTLFSFITAFLMAGKIIDTLYRFNVRKRLKIDLDTILETHKAKVGVPLMGGIIVILPVLMINPVFNSDRNVLILLTLILFAGIIGLTDDLLTVFGHERLTFRVRETVNPLVSFSELSWLFYRLLLKPWRMIKEFFLGMGSQASGLRAHEKFILELIIAGSAAAFLYFRMGLSSVWLPGLGPINIGIVYILWATLLMVGYASAFGLTDGLDGLSAGTHTLAFLAFGIIAFASGLFPLAFFCATVVGAELAFLYFNIYPARVEMSDVGTVPLGMAFALVGILTGREILLPVIGLVFTLEILSSFLQVVGVKHFKRKLFLMAPLHHHFEKLGWPETKVTMRLWWLGAISGLTGIVLAFAFNR